MKSKVRRYSAWGWICLTAFLTQCANIVAPSGGPRDEKPPVVVQMLPENNSTSFKERVIVLTFNEFIAIKDMTTELFVSPPMPNRPDVKVKGKSLVITLPRNLRDSTTYTLAFGKAVRDITEANILEDYTLSFSTGPYRDSLEIKGRILDAFTGMPVAGVIACLYDDLSDTAFLTTQPYYVARSNAQGDFSLKNLANKEYRLYALKDVNSNFYFDQPNESIAFHSGTVRPEIPIPEKDSTILLDADTLSDSTLTSGLYLTSVLRMFSNRDTSQALLKVWLMKSRQILISFRNPVDSIVVSVNGVETDSAWSILTTNETRDTITCWLRQDFSDSISLIIADVGKTLDTVSLSLRSRIEGRTPRKDVVEKQGFLPALSAKMMADAHRPIELIASYPIESHDINRMLWISEKDTIYPAFDPKLHDPTRLVLKTDAKPGMKYSLVVSDSALKDMRGYYNDSVSFSIQMRTVEDYGNFKMILLNPPAGSWFIEILDKDNRFLERLSVSSAMDVDLKHTLPGKYRFRVIHDINGNGRWDPGNFKARIQPEPVLYYDGEIEVRAKWERVETWDLAPLIKLQ